MSVKSTGHESQRQDNQAGQSYSGQQNKKIISVDKLQGECGYFSLADYHNIKLFQAQKGLKNEAKLKQAIENRFYFALLLFDVVFMQCADPLRSRIIYDILKDNSALIDEGVIQFVFSNSIDDIRRDYKKYIAEKIQEYKENKYSDTDVESLTQIHMTDEFYEEVISLLSRTPNMLKKRAGITFRELVMADLDRTPEVPIMGTADYSKSHIRLLNLSLYQLLKLRYVENGQMHDLFDAQKIDEFITSWQDHTDEGLPFSRHTFVEELYNLFTTGDKQQDLYKKKVIRVVETRMSLLYSKLNCGPHSVIEFHPATEKRSVYSWTYFEKYLMQVTNNHKPVLNCQRVKSIRELGDEWKMFRCEFLSCMACMDAKLSVAQWGETQSPTSRMDIFSQILTAHAIADRYPQISSILTV